MARLIPVRSNQDRLMVLRTMCRLIGLRDGPEDIEVPSREFPYFGVVAVGVPILPDVLDHALASFDFLQQITTLLWLECVRHFYSLPAECQRDSWNREVLEGAFQPGHLVLWESKRGAEG